MKRKRIAVPAIQASSKKNNNVRSLINEGWEPKKVDKSRQREINRMTNREISDYLFNLEKKRLLNNMFNRVIKVKFKNCLGF